MNRNDIIRMAWETGFDVNFDIRAVSVEGVHINKELERFANLVAAAEREACAKICENLPGFRLNTCDHFAAAIRERK